MAWYDFLKPVVQPALNVVKSVPGIIGTAVGAAGSAYGLYKSLGSQPSTPATPAGPSYMTNYVPSASPMGQSALGAYQAANPQIYKAPAAAATGGGGGSKVVTRSAQSYDDELESVLKQALAAAGISGTFEDKNFDETGARSEAEALYNPDAERQRTEVRNTIGLDKRAANEDYDRTAAELQQLKGVNTINRSVKTTQVADATGAAGTTRSGLGMRAANLNTIAGIQDEEDVTRQGNNANQIRNLSLDRATNTETNAIGKIDRDLTGNIADEVQQREAKFRESEAKRYSDYSTAYMTNYQRALAKVYGTYK